MAMPEATILSLSIMSPIMFPNTPIWMTEWGISFNGLTDGTTVDMFLSNLPFTPFHAFFMAGFELAMASRGSLFDIAVLWWFTQNASPHTRIYYTNSTATYATPEAQVISHLAAITQNATTVYGVSFANVPAFANTDWLGYYNQTLSYLQGAIYQSSTSLTVVILNRSNNTVSALQFPDASTGTYNRVAVVQYDGNKPLAADGYYQLNFLSPPSFPWMGPIAVSSVPAQNFSSTYQHDIEPLSLYVFTFSSSTSASSTSSSSASPASSVRPTLSSWLWPE